MLVRAAMPGFMTSGRNCHCPGRRTCCIVGDNIVQAHPVLRAEFPMLCQAANETGGIAIQNRGTLGGNIVNASPAAPI